MSLKLFHITWPAVIFFYFVFNYTCSYDVIYLENATCEVLQSHMYESKGMLCEKERGGVERSFHSYTETNFLLNVV